jgi:GTP cyclohydrolase I
MDKLLEMLGVQKLDEQKQDAIKEKLDTLIEVKAQETVTEMLKEEKDKLIEQYEEKFDAYKEDITSKFSNFVDEILDEQMTIPDKVLEYARKGEFILI